MDNLSSNRSFGNMRRVSAAHPCPVCGKPDWCLVAPDGTAAICTRRESDKRCGSAGHLNHLNQSTHTTDDGLAHTGREVPQRSIEASEGGAARGVETARRCPVYVGGSMAGGSHENCL